MLLLTSSISFLIVLTLISSNLAYAVPTTLGLPTTFPTNNRPQQLITSDVNNDGNYDIVTSASPYISVLLGNGNGTFGNPILSLWHPPQFGESSGGLVATRLNQDAYPDIVVADSTGGTLYIVIGNGDGTFGDGSGNNAQAYGGGFTARALKSADFNKDGFGDTVNIGTAFGDSNLVINYGTGNGTLVSGTQFGKPQFNLNFSSTAVGDLNNDSWIDVIAGNQSGAISVFLNNGLGNFPTSNHAQYPQGLDMGVWDAVDINSDGNLDVIGMSGDSVTVSLGQGNGTIGSPTQYFVGSDLTHNPLVKDFNGDGFPDIAVGLNNGSNPGSVKILENNGLGVFSIGAESAPLNEESALSPLASGDFNKDNKHDIVASNFVQPFKAYVFLNTTTQDSTPPVISALISPEPNSVGWNNTNVTVTFTCSDTESGIVNCPGPVTVSQEGGGQIIEGTATDNAGNSASTSVTLNIDKTNPSISYDASPAANSFGWNNSDVTVTFTCSDALSGIASCISPQTVSTEGANQPVSGTATDAAGNTATTTASVSLDKTNPTITYSLSPAPNQYGWHNSDVTVTFNCSDSLSGIDTCPAPFTITQEGGGQIFEGTATDKAGNSASAAFMVNIDKGTPAVSNLTWTANPLQQGQNTTLSATATDGLSGLASVQYSVDGGTPQNMTYNSNSGKWEASFGSALAANTYNITVTATDQAGNVSIINGNSTDILAVYNAANGYVTGHAKTLPTASDVMPIPRDTSNNPTKLIAGFSNVTSPMSGSFDVNYKIQNNQNEFNLSSTSINWVVVADSTHASILGKATLTVYQNGVMTQTQNMSVRFDITLGTNGNPDTISIKIYNPADNPSTATPVYTINDTVIPNGSNLMIRP